MARTSLAGIEVNTRALQVMLSGFDLFPSLVTRFLVGQNVASRGPGGQLVIEEDRWIALEPWLGMLEAIRAQIGPNALYRVGTRVFEARRFPPWVKDTESALHSIDVAYHQSHRSGGALMHDPATGQMLEGIGHFRAQKRVGRQEVRCDTPYPCEIDLGILAGVLERIEPRARVTHDPEGCRTNGAPGCTYVVTP